MVQPDAATRAGMTPMMQQYYDLKDEAGEAIVMFRMGDFYEIFGDDAEDVAPKLELVLTARERGDQKKVPFCGVPHHAAQNYWLKLLKMGYRVAIAEQVEDPKATKGLVKRAIVKTYTPGTIDELCGLPADSSNYLAAVFQIPDTERWNILLAEVSTGELRLGQVCGLGELKQILYRFNPSEILARKFQIKALQEELGEPLRECTYSHLPEGALRADHKSDKYITSVFGKLDLKKQPVGAIKQGEQLIAALFSYLEKVHTGLGSFKSVRPLGDPQTMDLHWIAARDLEVFESTRRREAAGSLFYEINHTCSPMGARLLRDFLLRPLTCERSIAKRHEHVEALHQTGLANLDKLQFALKGLPDLVRLKARLVNLSIRADELVKMRQALRQTQTLVSFIEGQNLGNKFHDFLLDLRTSSKVVKRLEAALADEPGSLGKGGEVIRDGYDSELDRLNEVKDHGSEQVDAYEKKLRQETGIASLKIKPHKTFGLLIEVTKSNLAKVPSDFIRRQTMVNNERFVTNELVELDETLAGAKELAIAREQSVYTGLITDMASLGTELEAVARSLAYLDVCLSFATKAHKANYCRANLSSESIMLQGSRHPVVERFVGSHRFVPNDISVQANKKHMLITGPNMAGKSTVMRQLALTALMNQIGSFVPASSAALPAFDQIFTRVGASDDLAQGQSTFYVEMAEAAVILRQASEKSLVILDEVGRGTSTSDGLAIARAILEELVGNIHCYSLFATHYHELVPVAANLSTVEIMQTQVNRKETEVEFTHRLVPGACGESYGVHVAKLAGVPTSVTSKAERYLDAPPAPNEGDAPMLIEQPQESFSNNHLRQISERLTKLTIQRTTPLQALNILNDLKSMVNEQEQLRLFD